MQSVIMILVMANTGHLKGLVNCSQSINDQSH